MGRNKLYKSILNYLALNYSFSHIYYINISHWLLVSAHYLSTVVGKPDYTVTSPCLKSSLEHVCGTRHHRHPVSMKGDVMRHSVRENFKTSCTFTLDPTG